MTNRAVARKQLDVVRGTAQAWASKHPKQKTNAPVPAQRRRRRIGLSLENFGRACQTRAMKIIRPRAAGKAAAEKQAAERAASLRMAAMVVTAVKVAAAERKGGADKAAAEEKETEAKAAQKAAMKQAAAAKAAAENAAAETAARIAAAEKAGAAAEKAEVQKAAQKAFLRSAAAEKAAAQNATAEKAAAERAAVEKAPVKATVENAGKAAAKKTAQNVDCIRGRVCDDVVVATDGWRSQPVYRPWVKGYTAAADGEAENWLAGLQEPVKKLDALLCKCLGQLLPSAPLAAHSRPRRILPKFVSFLCLE